jgi:hypothetical protein
VKSDILPATKQRLATLIDGYVVFWRKMKPLGVGLYLAGINNVPVVAPSLFWVSGLVYHWVPSLNDHSSPQVAVLVAALTAGGLLWIFLLPLAPVLAKALGAGQLASLERQTIRLKRSRARIQSRRRARDSFDVN